MPRLIDADELLNEMERDKEFRLVIPASKARDAPTIDPESLRPRGTWEGTADGYADGELVYDTWTCSECGYTAETDEPDFLTKFCPNCGAKMEVGY